MKRKEKKHPEITDAKELAKREEKNRFGTNAAKELDKQLEELQDFTNVTTEQLRFSPEGDPRKQSYEKRQEKKL